MNERADDICPRPGSIKPEVTRPHSPPLYFTSVWECDDTAQARRLLEGSESGYVYQRDGHPNADLLAEVCGRLHGSEHVAVTSSGMAALSLAVLSQLQQGDHLLVSDQLYGRSEWLLTGEAGRLGIAHTLVDALDLEAVRAAVQDNTRLMVAETISNPQLRVTDISALAEILHAAGARLLIDNTFATPVLCQPLGLGADLVMESVSKMMNGHGDVMLGMLAGSEDCWQRVPKVCAGWGLASSPMASWLATRGLATLHLRIGRAMENAMSVASYLAQQAEQQFGSLLEEVRYPGLPSHPDHELASRQLQGGFGSMVSFRLAGNEEVADRFLKAADSLPFCPSLGEASTTLSHPASTSHRDMDDSQLAKLGITGGTIRLSAGIESTEFILKAIEQGLMGAKG